MMTELEPASSKSNSGSSLTGDQRLDLGVDRVLQAVVAMERALAEMEARQRRRVNRMVVIVLAALAVFVAIILRFG